MGIAGGGGSGWFGSGDELGAFQYGNKTTGSFTVFKKRTAQRGGVRSLEIKLFENNLICITILVHLF